MAIRILIANVQSLVRRSVAELVRDSRENWVTTSRQLLRGAAVPYCAKLYHANNKRRIFHQTQQKRSFILNR